MIYKNLIFFSIGLILLRLKLLYIKIDNIYHNKNNLFKHIKLIYDYKIKSILLLILKFNNIIRININESKDNDI